MPGIGRRSAADALWSAMAVDPDLHPDQETGARGAYRRFIYAPLVRGAVRRVWGHRNPEPYLSARCFLQALSGDGWRRSSRRYEGLIGGGESEAEYRDLVEGRVRPPLIMVAGYPRSGTTSLQTIIRAAFPGHICERPSVDDRFSLWEYPKHTSTVIAEVARSGGDDVAVVVAARPFLDCAASLVVGRGGREHVDLRAELALWESWLPVYELPRVCSLPFAALTALSPAKLSEALSHLLEVECESPIEQSATYASLMSVFGKGVVDDPRQSNVPSQARAQSLAAARAWVVDSLGAEESARIDRAYSAIPFSMDPAGTVEPR